MVKLARFTCSVLLLNFNVHPRELRQRDRVSMFLWRWLVVSLRPEGPLARCLRVWQL